MVQKKIALKAAKYAVDLAKQLNASIIILSVIDNRPLISQIIPATSTTVHMIKPIDDYLREAAEGYVKEIKKLCDKVDFQSKTLITPGHPVEKIVSEARKLKAKLKRSLGLFGSCWYCHNFETRGSVVSKR